MAFATTARWSRWVYGFQLSDGVGDVHGFDALIAQTHHLAEAALSD
jgi:hypothetical protein